MTSQLQTAKDLIEQASKKKKLLNKVFIWSGYGFATKFKVVKETEDLLTLEVISTTLPHGLSINERFTNRPFALRNAIEKGNVQELINHK